MSENDSGVFRTIDVLSANKKSIHTKGGAKIDGNLVTSNIFVEEDVFIGGKLIIDKMFTSNSDTIFFALDLLPDCYNPHKKKNPKKNHNIGSKDCRWDHIYAKYFNCFNLDVCEGTFDILTTKKLIVKPSKCLSVVVEDNAFEIIGESQTLFQVDANCGVVNVNCLVPNTIFTNYHVSILDNKLIAMPSSICFIEIPKKIKHSTFKLNNLQIDCHQCKPCKDNEQEKEKENETTNSCKCKKVPNPCGCDTPKDSTDCNCDKDSKEETTCPNPCSKPRKGVVCKLIISSTCSKKGINIDIGNGKKIYLEKMGNNVELLFLPEKGYYQYMSGSYLP